MIRRSTRIAAIAAVIVCLPVMAGAQQSTSETALLHNELKLLRDAIDRLTSTTVWTQIAIARLMTQEQRTDASAKRTDELRSRLSRVTAQVSELTEQVTRFESRDMSGTSAKEQEGARLSLQSMKFELSKLETERQKLQLEETDASNQLAREQGRWEDLNKSLDELEKTFAPKRR